MRIPDVLTGVYTGRCITKEMTVGMYAQHYRQAMSDVHANIFFSTNSRDKVWA